jgi:xylulokinase
VTSYLLGVDIGTYSSKGVLVSAAGDVAASHVIEHSLSMPRPGWVEHDAEGVWWHDFAGICRAVIDRSGVPPSQIAAVGVSTIAPCVLPVDAEGRPLRPAILYGIDTRASREIEELEAAIGRDALFERHGTRLSSQSTGPKIVWLRKHEPEVWGKTLLILGGAGYIVYKLTGEAVIDVYDAATYAPLFDLSTLKWNPEMAGPIAPLDRLPRVTWTSEIAGRVRAAASRETGLAEGTPVIAGTADAAAEAISAGLVRTGDMMVMYGSSIFFILKTGRIAPSRRFWSGPFLEPGAYAVAGGMSTAGSVLRWFRDQFAREELKVEAEGGESAYAALAALARESPPGAKGLIALPYFAGERTPLHDPAARGVLFGLGLEHTRADVYRALLEGVGHGIRHNLEAMAEEGGAAKRILAVGGGTLNRAWMQIVSDIAGIEQQIPEQRIGAAYGDAFLAGAGVGLFRSTADVGAWVKIGECVRPDPEARRIYDRSYRIYRELYTRTAGLMREAGAFEGEGA